MYRFLVRGIVQGVGFRPFIYGYAFQKGLRGNVRNTGDGVVINLDTDFPDQTADDIKRLAPPLSVITSITYEKTDDSVPDSFSIIKTESTQGFSFVPPDTAICPDCLKDIADPHGRRFEYPFTNCTNCGPRYTIIRNMPYDRHKTVMDSFEMCPQCFSEYENPADRRFHAQPNACPVCGPGVYYRNLAGINAIEKIAELIDKGEIVAVKGLGGYHLICDAANDKPINLLRQIKNRPEKPLAVMCLPETLEKLNISDDEKLLILSPAAPIVVIKDSGAAISAQVNPISASVGFMTAYTPLHAILLKKLKTDFIVATSGNLKDEPIAKDPEKAEDVLSAFTEHFLHHNREIYNRCDDSLASVINGTPYILRRARGLAPFPVVLPSASEKCVMGVGAHLKSTISLGKSGFCFISQFIGDLDHPETAAFYTETADKLEQLYNLKPELIVHDLHPGYHSTSFAAAKSAETIGLQHHAAHMFACMAENGLTDNVLGLILDGTGLGTDKTIWGGEFLLLKNGVLSRKAHLPVVAQPGMDSAAKNPARMLVSYLYQFGLLEENEDLLVRRLGLKPKDISLILSMIEKNINTIQTSSCGRLLESVGALVTITPVNLFEAHSAMKLEGVASGSGRSYGVIPPCELLSRVIRDIRDNISPAEISEAVHNSFSQWAANKVYQICMEEGIKDVVLSGGVFQNLLLAQKISGLLKLPGITPHLHKKVSPNDSCVSLGQVFFAVLSDSLKIIL